MIYDLNADEAAAGGNVSNDEDAALLQSILRAYVRREAAFQRGFRGDLYSQGLDSAIEAAMEEKGIYPKRESKRSLPSVLREASVFLAERGKPTLSDDCATCADVIEEILTNDQK